MRISDWSSDVCSSDLQRDVQDKARALLKSRLTDMTAQKDELPPCPFCGNEPVLLTATEWDGFERYTEVRCDHCGISIDNEYKADAIAAWKHCTPTASPDSGMVEKLREALELIRAMLSQHSGSQSLLGDAFKVADAALQPQDVPTNGDAGTGARADEKLTDDLNDILQPFHWEAWKAALFSDHPDGWPDDDEQDAICQRVDSMAVGEHYQAWSEEVQEKIVSLFSHRLQSTAELRAKLEDANSLISDGPLGRTSGRECVSTCRSRWSRV